MSGLWVPPSVERAAAKRLEEARGPVGERLDGSTLTRDEAQAGGQKWLPPIDWSTTPVYNVMLPAVLVDHPPLEEAILRRTLQTLQTGVSELDGEPFGWFQTNMGTFCVSFSAAPHGFVLRALARGFVMVFPVRERGESMWLASLPRRPAATSRKPGRNDPCPCGSRLKWKRCHGR